MDTYEKAHKERKRINFELQDVDGNIVGCTSWNEYAQQFKDFLDIKNPTESVMAVIQHGKINEWHEIDEVFQLRKSLLVQQGQAGGSSSQSILSSTTVFPVRQEFLIDYPKKNVDDIIEIETTMSCVVVATIKIVQENYGWFYPACRKCFKKVLTKTEYLQYAQTIAESVMNLAPTSLVCPKCEEECTSVTIKFKVHVRVQDETGSVTFVMFDKDVMKIVGSSASDIREHQVKSNDTQSFPFEHTQFLEKKLAFKVDITQYNLNHDYRVYTVQKICDDPDILDELVADNVVSRDGDVADEVSQEVWDSKAVQLSEDSQRAGDSISNRLFRR
ncbi:uncharacterized protein LOC110922610 [Helianthus annuus]|uniref:uncharacterized protein LOC110922610 n=1 Tax=Helianthus annuus TaxID=4232 RepID=UPI000B8FB207|nr:uncharacterized protein LOC110922610 [Helianthus annuus]